MASDANEDLKKGEAGEGEAGDEAESEPSASASDDAKPAEGEDSALARASTAPDKADKADKAEASEERAAEEDQPVQLGYQRYVYAAYMAGAMLVGFLVAKIGHAGWYRLGQWKPEFGEPQDEILYPVAGLIGVLVAVYYYRKPDARQYADEVAEELSKVTWPSRKEVSNSTTVVVLTTLFATVYFALMDRFWAFVTDKIYTF